MSGIDPFDRLDCEWPWWAVRIKVSADKMDTQYREFTVSATTRTSAISAAMVRLTDDEASEFSAVFIHPLPNMTVIT